MGNIVNSEGVKQIALRINSMQVLRFAQRCSRGFRSSGTRPRVTGWSDSDVSTSEDEITTLRRNVGMLLSTGSGPCRSCRESSVYRNSETGLKSWQRNRIAIESAEEHKDCCVRATKPERNHTAPSEFRSTGAPRLSVCSLPQGACHRSLCGQ
jgi:hypothetical protein